MILGDNLRMNFAHEDFFIVRPIEDSDGAAWRQGIGGAPEKVVFQFKRARAFECADFDAVWVHAAHDVTYGAIFSCGIHGLKD